MMVFQLLSLHYAANLQRFSVLMLKELLSSPLRKVENKQTQEELFFWWQWF
jgi:hypothetical protein